MKIRVRRYVYFINLLFLPCFGCSSLSPLFQGSNDSGALTSLKAPPAQIQVTAQTSSDSSASIPLPVESETDAGDPENNSTVSEDTTWRGRIVVRGVVTISSQATLTIEPGTEIVFTPGKVGRPGGVLCVQGRVSAKGGSEKPIRFAFENGTDRRGAWQGIVLLGSEKKNVLEHCRIEGADVGLDIIYSSVSLKSTFFASCRVGMRSQGGLLLLTGGGASNCESGFILNDSEADFREATFEANRVGLSIFDTSLHLESAAFSSNTAIALECDGSKIALYRCTFKKNGSGVIITSSDGSLEGNRIVSSLDFGMRITRSRMKVFGNTVSLNTGVGILVSGKGSAFWGNNITLNGLYNMYNEGIEDVTAVGNWWGYPAISRIMKSIFDRADDTGRGTIRVVPMLSAEIGMP